MNIVISWNWKLNFEVIYSISVSIWFGSLGEFGFQFDIAADFTQRLSNSSLNRFENRNVKNENIHFTEKQNSRFKTDWIVKRILLGTAIYLTGRSRPKTREKWSLRFDEKNSVAQESELTEILEHFNLTVRLIFQNLIRVKIRNPENLFSTRKKRSRSRAFVVTFVPKNSWKRTV